jgi:ribulose-5-phosphate 4-epimerase/fuculose-1-phosphate aldolase
MGPTAKEDTNERGYHLREQTAQNITLGGDIPFQIPEFTNLEDKRKWMLQHMAGAFRVFARKGYTEGSAGHISLRDPINPDTFWINPLGVHYALLKASDMVQVDEQGNVIGGSRRAINAAGFKIHSAIHKARPDVIAACHTHSIHGKAYSSFGKPLDMLNQDVCIFYKAHSVYDDFGGIVLEDEEGGKIAEALGNNKAVILRNHGLLTVGSTVDEAAYLFTLMERSCEAQLLIDAAAAGSGKKPRLVSSQDAEYTYQATSDPDSLYLEFQPDFEYEIAMDNGKFLN